MREKLLEILKNNATCVELGIEGCDSCPYGRVEDCYTHALADHLIANDVTPVVRCKDCKHYKYRYETDDGKWHGICDHSTEHLLDDSFCSYGERKDND